MLCFTCNTFQDFQWKFLIHMTKERVVIVPGNGRGDVEHSNWYGWLKSKLLEKNIDCLLRNMPDPAFIRVPVPALGPLSSKVCPEGQETKEVRISLQNLVLAREEIWIPFMEKQLNCDEHTVIVGHSSGAQAALRYAEKHSVLGLILVSPCVTDLDDPNEKASGYYNRPWEWEQIKQNTQWIVQFGSTDDPFIPFSEQEQVAEGTASEFHKFSDKGHFQSFAFSDLMNILIGKLKQECGE